MSAPRRLDTVLCQGQVSWQSLYSRSVKHATVSAISNGAAKQLVRRVDSAKRVYSMYKPIFPSGNMSHSPLRPASTWVLIQHSLRCFKLLPDWYVDGPGPNERTIAMRHSSDGRSFVLNWLIDLAQLLALLCATTPPTLPQLTQSGIYIPIDRECDGCT
jgi:hypothetical protein